MAPLCGRRKIALLGVKSLTGYDKMFEQNSAILYDILERSALLEEPLLEELKVEHRRRGVPLANLLLEAGLADRRQIIEATARYLGFDFAAELPESIDEETAALIPSSLALSYSVVPMGEDEHSIFVLAKDPFNSQIADDLSFSLGKAIRIAVGEPDEVARLINSTYGEKGEKGKSTDENIEQGALPERLESSPGIALEEGPRPAELNDLSDETTVVQLVERVLRKAVREKASDIHFEPFEKAFHIRYRVDGVLYAMDPLPRRLSLPVISRIKVLSNLNISEQRVPQDGRIRLWVAERPVDLRVSTLPTQHGESVVVRVLDKTVVRLSLDRLNLPEDILRNIRKIVRRPNGIFIVTGPTGSGKTTTLYSALKEVNKAPVKILTAEDPVEYEIDGIMQVSINHRIGLGFARVMRAFLRHDPDKILVGEIRDLETARIAVQASLTGHLVMSTLHTNDAPGAVTRLIDMGLEPYLLASTLEAVLGQRLVRRLCPRCRLPWRPPPELVGQLNLAPEDRSAGRYYHGKGCAFCNQTGYRGRLGLFEMLMVSDSLRDGITSRISSTRLKRKAVAMGMRVLRDDGIRAIFEGETAIEEVLKYT